MDLDRGGVCKSSPLVESDELHVTSQQRGDFHELADIPKLAQEILVSEQFVCTPGNQALRSTERECGYSRFIAITASFVS